jgi:hypothetical protein
MTDELLRALGQQQRCDPLPSSAMLPNSTDVEAILRPFDTEEREVLLDRVMERLDDVEDEPQTRSCPRS